MVENNMAKLYKITKNLNQEKAEMLIENLEIAETFLGRAKGLLGRKSLSENQALWIKPCNNIHTFFMKFTIDCVFINKSCVVEKIYSKVSPFEIKGPVWKANSVIEFSEGIIEKWDIKIGDQLHVVS
jgi:uncharacterized membrane protein (UPF0127 family)